MGFMDSLRKQFDRGGIKVKLDLPKGFNWADGVIPAQVTVTGHKAEPRKVREFHFLVQDDEKSQSSSDSTPSVIRVEWTQEGEIDLAPGETRQFDLGIVIPPPATRSEKEDQAFGRPAQGFMEKAFMAVAGAPSPESFNRYLVTVEVEVEGAAKPKKATQHIKQGRGMSVSIGGATMKF